MITGTIELRGRADIDDGQALKDAQALLKFLIRRGVVSGDAGALPPLACQGTALDAVDFVKAPHAGLLVQKRALGEKVRTGDVVSEIIEPMSSSGAGRTQLMARTDGVIFARSTHGLVRAGERVMKIAGKEKLEQTDATLLGD